MCTLHLRSQLLQRAELQLLHRSFALSELLRNFSNALLLDETSKDYAALFSRKFLD
jgi:lipopolysaccharide biosynthesis regulator YciM